MANTSNTDHSSNVRLAESDSVAVDMCGCGTLQVHLGDLSLRLPPEMVGPGARPREAKHERSRRG